mmetsp:Transcript_19844/g.50406  ORF Transcript_19844/g.50406 Transcript_19844/m.50406 type:complete len:94 (+) Transcript_19844:168-449(+)
MSLLACPPPQFLSLLLCSSATPGGTPSCTFACTPWCGEQEWLLLRVRMVVVMVVGKCKCANGAVCGGGGGVWVCGCLGLSPGDGRLSGHVQSR